MTNKIDILLKAITNRIARALPSDTVKNPKISTSPVLSTRSYPTINPQFPSHPSNSINAIKAHFKEATISQTILRQPKIETEPQQLEDPEPTLKDEFQDLNLNLPVLETGHIFRLPDGTKSYPVGIVKDVEVHIGKLKLLNDFYVIDIKKDPETPFLVGRGFLATANVVIDCRMAKIAVGEGITRSIFGVKGVDLREEEVIFDEKKLGNCRKFHLLEDKQIPSVEHLEGIWKAFAGNTRDLGSFREETDKTTDLHQHLSRISTQKLETASQITLDAVITHLKTASHDLQTVSECTTHPII
ncbi:MAK10-like protein [Tanacetum coccineum]